MNYNPLKRVIQIAPADAERAAHILLWAMKHIRLASGRPLDRHSRDCAMDSADFAQAGIMDAAKALGLDLGADCAEQIDLRDVR
jgi:hypothetical protein